MAPYQQKRLDDIITQLTPYKVLKDRHKQQRIQASQDGKPDWLLHLLEIEQERERMESAECKVFSDLAAKATTDPHFERYFRAAFLKVFLTINLDHSSIRIPVPGSNGKHFT